MHTHSGSWAPWGLPLWSNAENPGPPDNYQCWCSWLCKFQTNDYPTCALDQLSNCCHWGLGCYLILYSHYWAVCYDRKLPQYAKHCILLHNWLADFEIGAKWISSHRVLFLTESLRNWCPSQQQREGPQARVYSTMMVAELYIVWMFMQ